MCDALNEFQTLIWVMYLPIAIMWHSMYKYVVEHDKNGNLS